MEIEEKVQQINTIITKESWFDMEIIGNKGGNLMIAGSIDFTYGHSLEITFLDVFYMSINKEWRTDTSKPVIEIVIGEEARNINSQYRIEEGHVLFKIQSEELEVPFYISAQDIKFDTTKVLYYKKDNLEDNEKVAEWIE